MSLFIPNHLSIRCACCHLRSGGETLVASVGLPLTAAQSVRHWDSLLTPGQRDKQYFIVCCPKQTRGQAEFLAFYKRLFIFPQVPWLQEGRTSPCASADLHQSASFSALSFSFALSTINLSLTPPPPTVVEGVFLLH